MLSALRCFVGGQLIINALVRIVFTFLNRPVHYIGAFVPLFNRFCGMGGFYVIIIANILAEKGSKFLHAVDIEMLMIIKIVLRIKTYSIVCVFKINEAVTVAFNKLFYFRRRFGVPVFQAMRRSDKQYILDSLIPTIIQEPSYIL